MGDDDDHGVAAGRELGMIEISKRPSVPEGMGEVEVSGSEIKPVRRIQQASWRHRGPGYDALAPIAKLSMV